MHTSSLIRSGRQRVPGPCLCVVICVGVRVCVCRSSLSLFLVGGRPWSQLKMVLISSPMGEENGLSMATERRSRGEEHQSSTIRDPLSSHTHTSTCGTHKNKHTHTHTHNVYIHIDVHNFAYCVYTFLLHSYRFRCKGSRTWTDSTFVNPKKLKKTIE